MECNCFSCTGKLFGKKECLKDVQAYQRLMVHTVASIGLRLQNGTNVVINDVETMRKFALDFLNAHDMTQTICCDCNDSSDCECVCHNCDCCDEDDECDCSCHGSDSDDDE